MDSMIRVDTGALRSSASSYDGVAQDCLTAAKGAATAGHALGTAIDEGGVSAAVANAMVSITQQLQLVGGAAAYAGDQLASSAEEYDAADARSGSRLAALRPGSPR